MAYVSLNTERLSPLFENLHYVYNALIETGACDSSKDFYQEIMDIDNSHSKEDNYQFLLFNQIKKGIETLNPNALITFIVDGARSKIFYQQKSELNKTTLAGLSDYLSALCI